MLTLDELINQSDLGIRLVTGPADSSARRVAGVHAVGARDRFRWPAPDWLILLDDARLGRPALRRRVIDNAVAASLCAVAVRTGGRFDAVPPEMVSHARAGRMPLLAVAPEVPFPSIVHFVDRRLEGAADGLLGHLRTAHDALHEALALVAAPAQPAGGRRGPPGTVAAPPDPAGGAVELAVARLERSGVRLDQGVRVVAVAEAAGALVRAATTAVPDGLLHRIRDGLDRTGLAGMATSLNRTGLASMASSLDNTVLVLVPTADQRPVAAMIATTGGRVHAGISGVITEPHELNGAAHGALTALRHLQHRAAAPGAMLSADELTVAGWLTGSAEPDELRRRVRQQFGGLREHPELSATLVRWLADDRNVPRVAQAMHLHPNTVRYRLGRVEKITCCRLSDLSTLANLYLALLACPEELGIAAGSPGRPSW
jgi:purine catabolism regulator